MIATETPTWEAAFELVLDLEQEPRLILRRAASAALVAEGAGEVGSSDINHYLYRRFCAAGSWEEVMTEMVYELPC